MAIAKVILKKNNNVRIQSVIKYTTYNNKIQNGKNRNLPIPGVPVTIILS